MNNINVTQRLTRDQKLVLFVGKGGVGRTYLANLTARQLAAEGKRVLLVQILDDTLALDNAKRHVRKTLLPNLQEILLSPHEAFEEYVGLKLHMPRLARFALSNKAVQYLERSAPGVREIVLLGKIWADRKNYDHVVVDMPSSGYALTMLGVPRNFARLFPLGPIYQDCLEMLKTFDDPAQVKFFLVSLCEELPLQESLEFAQELQKILPHSDPFWIINKLIEPDAEKLEELADWVKKQGSGPQKTNTIFLTALALRVERAKNQNRALASLDVNKDKILLMPEAPPEAAPSPTENLEAITVNHLTQSLQDLKRTALASSHEDLLQLLKTAKIIISCGLGGVGKTTSSAALGLAAAMMGRKTLVITIDPAKRLASALGLDHSDLRGQDITAKVSDALQEKIPGSFSALIPATDQIFENFIRSVGKGQEKSVERILKTSIFKLFAQDFAGAHEYMAMEALHQIVTSANPPELIILDTPPASNTRMFLDAPNALTHFFDESIGKWLGNRGGKLLSSGVQKLFEVLEKVTGKGFLSELVEFASSLFELRTQFLNNLEEVAQILRGNNVQFLMVCTAERISKEETARFLDELQNKKFPFWGFLINRTLMKKINRLPQAETVGEMDFPFRLNHHLQLLKRRFFLETRTFQILMELGARHKDPKLGNAGKIQQHLFCFPEIEQDIHSIKALHILAKEILNE